MGQPMDYGPVAGTYAKHRWALSWKTVPLRAAVVHAGPSPTVLDLGCGTGDYLSDLHDQFASSRLFGCDRSREMIRRANVRCPAARFMQMDLDHDWPIRPGKIAVLYSVDVFHHLRDPARVIRESFQALATGGRLCVISDSTDDIHARSLAKLFPETVPINLERYPRVEDLCRTAGQLGFRLSSRATVWGVIELDERFLAALESRAMSELRLISTDQHQAGMQRAREWASGGEAYVSQSTALTWIKQ